MDHLHVGFMSFLIFVCMYLITGFGVRMLAIKFATSPNPSVSNWGAALATIN